MKFGRNDNGIVSAKFSIKAGWTTENSRNYQNWSNDISFEVIFEVFVAGILEIFQGQPFPEILTEYSALFDRKKNLHFLLK